MKRQKLKVFHLNYDWDYVPKYNEKFIENFPKSKKINIPHTNIELPYNNFSEKLYQFISSYQKVFEFKKKKGKRYILHFDGVMEYSIVYVNNKHVISHKGGYTPFDVDITDNLINGSNKIFVMVDSTERIDIPPHGFVVDYLTYGGIYREVYIEEQIQSYINHAFIYYDADSLEIKMFLNYDEKNSKVFTYNIYKGDELVNSFEREYYFRDEIQVSQLMDLDRWSIDNPVMYSLDILIDNVLSYSSTFGSRRVEFTTEGFYINGENTKLRGLNRHQSFPYVGYAMPRNAQRKDADILKYELGCNIVRSSHYPPSKHFLDRCDEIGLLVFDEMPGWQHIGNEEWQEVALKNVEEMIFRDYNHPSIVIWGVRINESSDNDEFYKKTNILAKSLDEFRPTGGVRNFKGSHFFEDVYTYNDFVHRGINEGLEESKKVTKMKVPYLITEYNGHMYPTKKFDDEWHRVYQAKRHLKVQNDSYKYNGISGAIGWCAFDYNTHKDFGSGDRICYHGVMDMFRIPKYAAAAYSSQSDINPYLEVLSNLNIGEQEASEIKQVYVLTNTDYVKFFIDNELIGKFYPSKMYKDLPHPPVIIDDFIGNQIHKNETFSKRDKNRIKDILKAIMVHGKDLPLKYKIKLKRFLFKNKMTYDDALRLYAKYVGKWGAESTTYRFEGYLNDKLVLNKEIGTSHISDLYLEQDDKVITEINTYETTRVIVKHLDEFLNPLTYSSEVINIKVTGPLELIGPPSLALLGGSTGFFLKTKGTVGIAKITVSSNNFKNKIIEIEVK
ncbi:MAG: Beta-galactosidase [Candidatus Izimaplasma bacterium HR2]|nr:MAG: Beta-galactosidase [Candidatus Izimaplasma bacterium HR2]